MAPWQRTSRWTLIACRSCCARARAALLAGASAQVACARWAGAGVQQRLVCRREGALHHRPYRHPPHTHTHKLPRRPYVWHHSDAEPVRSLDDAMRVLARRMTATQHLDRGVLAVLEAPQQQPSAAWLSNAVDAWRRDMQQAASINGSADMWVWVN